MVNIKEKISTENDKFIIFLNITIFSHTQDDYSIVYFKLDSKSDKV